MRRSAGDDHHVDAVDVHAVTHYEVLGVAPSAPTSEVRRAYVTLARQHHPDRDGGDDEAMRALNDAWATLSDPDRRATYDRTLLAVPRPTVVPEGGPRTRVDDPFADLDDDTPIGGQIVLPRWFALLPVAMFAASLAALLVAMLFSSAPAIAMAVALFALSCAMFLMSPFVALLASRRRG